MNFIELKTGGFGPEGLMVKHGPGDFPIHQLLDSGFQSVSLVAKVTNGGKGPLLIEACVIVLEAGPEVPASRQHGEKGPLAIQAAQSELWFVPFKELFDLAASNFRAGISDALHQSVHAEVRLTSGTSLRSRKVLIAPTALWCHTC